MPVGEEDAPHACTLQLLAEKEKIRSNAAQTGILQLNELCDGDRTPTPWLEKKM